MSDTQHHSTPPTEDNGSLAQSTTSTVAVKPNSDSDTAQYNPASLSYEITYKSDLTAPQLSPASSEGQSANMTTSSETKETNTPTAEQGLADSTSVPSNTTANQAAPTSAETEQKPNPPAETANSAPAPVIADTTATTDTTDTSSESTAAPVNVDLLYDEQPRIKLYDEHGQEYQLDKAASSASQAASTGSAASLDSKSSAPTASNSESDSAPLYDNSVASDSEDQMDFANLMAQSIFAQVPASDTAANPASAAPVAAPAPDSNVANAGKNAPLPVANTTSAALPSEPVTKTPVKKAPPKPAPAPIMPSTPARALNGNQGTSILDNGSMLAEGHTAIMGLENRSKAPLYTPHSTVITGMSPEEIEVIKQINALNAKKRVRQQQATKNFEAEIAAEEKARREGRDPAAAAAAVRAQATQYDSADTDFAEPRLQRINQGQQSAVNTGSTHIIANDHSLAQRLAAQSDAASSGHTAAARLRSTLAADQVAYDQEAREQAEARAQQEAWEREQQAKAQAAAAAAAAAAAEAQAAAQAELAAVGSTGQSSSSMPYSGMVNDAALAAAAAESGIIDLGHISELDLSGSRGSFDSNGLPTAKALGSATDETRLNHFSGSVVGTALDEEEVLGVGFGNAYESGHAFDTQGRPTTPATQQQHQRSLQAEQAQPAIMVPDDYQNAGANDEGYSPEGSNLDLNGYGYSPYDTVNPSPSVTDSSGEDDGPHYVVGVTKRHAPQPQPATDTEDDGPHYVVGMTARQIKQQQQQLAAQAASAPQYRVGIMPRADEQAAANSPASAPALDTEQFSASAAAPDSYYVPAATSTSLPLESMGGTAALQPEQTEPLEMAVPQSEDGYLAPEVSYITPGVQAPYYGATDSVTTTNGLEGVGMAASAADTAATQINAAASNDTGAEEEEVPLYPGVYATKLEQQQKQQRARQAAQELARQQAAAAAAAAATTATQAQGQEAAEPLPADTALASGMLVEGTPQPEQEEHGPTPAGMGDGLLAQVPPENVTPDATADDGPHYVVGPSKKNRQVAANSVEGVGPIYAVGVDRTNAQVEAQIQAERSRLQPQVALPPSYLDQEPHLTASETEADAEERAYAEALEEAARESMAAPQSEVIRRARELAAQDSKHSTTAKAAATESEAVDSAERAVDTGLLLDDDEVNAATATANATAANKASLSAPTHDMDLGEASMVAALGEEAYAAKEEALEQAQEQAQAQVQAQAQSEAQSVLKAQQALKHKQRRDSEGRYNFANMPEKEHIGLGIAIFLYLRQLGASFFTFTSLSLLAPHMAMRLGFAFPSSMAIPFFCVGLVSGLVGAYFHHDLHLAQAGVITFVLYQLLIGLTAYRGIYRISTFISRRRRDMILLAASVITPMVILIWLINTLMIMSQGYFEATLLFAIAAMLSAATASTLTWNFPQDPIDSCGMMSGKGLGLVVVLCLLVSFGFLHYIVGLSVLGVSIVMRLIFGYCLVKNKGTAQRPYVHALQLLTLFAILLDIILLKSQNYEIISGQLLQVVQELRMTVGL